MEEVIRLEPSTSGCDVPTCGTVSVYLIAGMEGFALLAIPASSWVIAVIYIKRTRYLMTQTTMSQTTMNLNRMLMMALLLC
uniref:Uncharacterized protein n=1 Tax=Acrobeloides nanus TaxID=290746 RepID=A0A914CXP6_9BILA